MSYIELDESRKNSASQCKFRFLYYFLCIAYLAPWRLISPHAHSMCVDEPSQVIADISLVVRANDCHIFWSVRQVIAAKLSHLSKGNGACTIVRIGSVRIGQTQIEGQTISWITSAHLSQIKQYLKVFGESLVFLPRSLLA